MDQFFRLEKRRVGWRGKSLAGAMPFAASAESGWSAGQSCRQGNCEPDQEPVSSVPLTEEASFCSASLNGSTGLPGEVKIGGKAFARPWPMSGLGEGG